MNDEFFKIWYFGGFAAGNQIADKSLILQISPKVIYVVREGTESLILKSLFTKGG
jgi:hypothetical protein